MSLKPKQTEKKSEVIDKNYRSKLLFSIDSKPQGAGTSFRKIPGSSANSQVQSQACLHQRSNKQSSLVKKGSTDRNKATLSAARLKEVQYEKSPREKLEKKLLEMHKGMLRGFDLKAEAIIQETAKEERSSPVETRKSIRGLVNDVSSGENILNRLSYKSMSSISSDKKSAIIKDQKVTTNHKNLFSTHFRNYDGSCDQKAERERESKVLKTSSSMSQNLHEAPMSVFTRKAMESFAKGVSSTGNLPAMRGITSTSTIESAAFPLTVSTTKSPPLAQTSNFKKIKLFTPADRASIEKRSASNKNSGYHDNYVQSKKMPCNFLGNTLRDQLEPVNEESNAELRDSIKDSNADRVKSSEIKLKAFTVFANERKIKASSKEKRKTPAKTKVTSSVLDLLPSQGVNNKISEIKELKIKSRELKQIASNYSQGKSKHAQPGFKSGKTAPTGHGLERIKESSSKPVEKLLYQQKVGESIFTNKSQSDFSEDFQQSLKNFAEYPSTTDRLDRLEVKNLSHERSFLRNTMDISHQNIYDPNFSAEKNKKGSSKLKSKDRLFRQRSSTSSMEVRKSSTSVTKESVIEGYKLIREIGRGTYAVVYKCCKVKTDQAFAIKMYEKKSLVNETKRRNVEEEIANLKKLRHPAIVKYSTDFETSTRSCIVMEYAGKTSLLEHLKKRSSGCLSEIESRDIFQKLLAGVKHCHENQVAHRDLKLENITIFGLKGKVKIIDFGFSISVPKHRKIADFCGTMNYISPEIVLREPYDPMSADIWALGVILYRTLIGDFPFNCPDNTEEGLVAAITNCKYEFPAESQHTLSNHPLRIIKMIFQADPAQRPTANELLEDPWFSDKINSTHEELD